jgi:hypothetical protein
MLKLGKGVGRAAVKRALAGRKRPTTFSYTGVLRPADIREALAGIRDAGSPKWSLPLQTWFASHSSSPVDVLRDLLAHGGREVLMSLAMNPNLPADMKKALLTHEDAEIREHANHVFSKTRKH